MNGLKHPSSKLKSILFIVTTVLLCCAACVVLFCLNIQPSLGLEQELRCGMVQHSHTDACYNGDFLTCTKQVHAHNQNCYIVLLGDNDINHVLTLLEEEEDHSLESVITHVMNTALAFNTSLNTADSAASPMVLTKSTVEALNSTISEESDLPDLILNENINNAATLTVDGAAADNGIAALAVDSNPNTANYNANFYVYLDGQWTCIGTLPFSTTANGTRYNCTLATQDVLDLVNSSLGTNYTYDSFDISSATSLNGTYSTNNISVGSVTTTVGYRQNSNNARRARYVRLIPVNGSASSTAFAFYTVTVTYPEGTAATYYIRSGDTLTLPSGNYEWRDQNGNAYAAGETVTITGTTAFTGTTLGPITYININYNINFPTISGVTVETQPTIAGLSSGTVTDGFTENASATIRNVSQQSVEGKLTDNTTGLSRVIYFKGWQVGNTDTVLKPYTTLLWDELLQYANGASLTLTALWDTDPLQTASFFIRFDSVAVDTDGNITGQDSNKYTSELFASYVGGVDPSLGYEALNEQYNIANTTADNSYGSDQEIRALYGEKTEGIWLHDFPSDDYIFESLQQYAQTGYLSVDGVAVKAEDLNHNSYAIRWYVLKCQSDAWHIDGKLVKKEGMFRVRKTFSGNKELIALAKENFYIDAYDVAADTHNTLTLTNYTEYDAATETYLWEINNVDYGELWEIEEFPTMPDTVQDQYSMYTEHTIMDAYGDQSATGTATKVSITGMTYAFDSGLDDVLRVDFNNIYNKSNAILIKKQDSLTGVPIGGASFTLSQNETVLKFTYNSETDSYQYDPVNGTITVLEGNTTGYFELLIENFSYDQGPITVKETTPPTGYTPIGNIEIGYTDSQNTVGILSGNSDLIQYVGGILLIGNSTDSSSVTAKKAWDCPESEWQPVTVQLLANGKLVTTVIAGVPSQAILSNENNWSYTWENLPVYVNGTEITWSIKEIQIGTENCKADGSFVNWLASYELPVYATNEKGDKHTTLTVTNTVKRVMLRLTKTDLSKTIALKGAVFLLEAVDQNGNVIASEIAKTATTGEGGTLVFDNLKCGVRYRLTETAAPEGYLNLDEPIYFTIQEDGSVTVEDSYYASAGTSAYNIVVRNAEGVALPESGGMGTGMFYAFGTLLIVTAGIYIGMLRTRRCQHY